MTNFVWADLSTYDTATSISFYEQAFGWRFQDAGSYFVAMQDSAEVVGLFETPAFFKKIKMPHFWMSYIAVEDALATAELAKEFADAKVELIDDFYGGKVALIRDPQGAGFTAYDGGKLNARQLDAGRLIWNELHVSNAMTVIPFYERLFNWKITQGEAADKYKIYTAGRDYIGDLLSIPNAVKGKYEYWVCSFAVDDLQRSKEQIEALGGGVVSDEGERLMMHDNSGEAFFYVQCLS